VFHFPLSQVYSILYQMHWQCYSEMLHAWTQLCSGQGASPSHHQDSVQQAWGNGDVCGQSSSLH
jgi:hypothetical protein